MFYRYFRPINFICNIFGVLKPNITSNGKSIPSNLLVNIWCFIVGALFVVNYVLPKTKTKLKDDLEIISDVNDLVANIIIILINVFNSTKIYVSIHKTFNIVFNDFNLDFNILKSFALKMYFWFALPTIAFIVLIIMEILSKNPPYDLFIRIPMFLSLMHLYMHIFVTLALTKVINSKLYKILIKNELIPNDEDLKPQSNIKYILSPSIKFMKFNDHVHFDIKLLCKIYDNIATCIHLLELIHGLEILISIWLMFISGVVGMTLIVCNKAKIIWLVYVKSVLPFFWGFIGCCIDEQLRSEVDQTITLIIKCLIDYKCAPTMKPALETFKALATNDRLQFTACSLFHLNYAMLLGTVLNVVTYSIILIQMFLK